jgi:hypothetical protein
MTGIEQGPEHVVFGIGEARIVESHALSQGAEDLDIRPSLTRRRQRGARELQIVVSVGVVEVGVLKERGHREQDIGEIRRIGSHLLQHHGEEIRSPQTAQHRVLIRRHGRGIRVVNNQRLHGRLKRFIER